MPTDDPRTIDVRSASRFPRMFARGVGRPGPGTPLIYDDLTKSPTWTAIEEVLVTLRQYPDATVTVGVMGTVIEYSRQPFSASPDTVSIEGPSSSGPSPATNVVDLRRT